MSFKIEHLHNEGILHTWFEKGSQVDSLDDVRQMRDRLMHALLEWHEGPVWVACLDNLEVAHQWFQALEGLFQDALYEGVKEVIRYVSDERILLLWNQRLEKEFGDPSGALGALVGSRDEAFLRARQSHAPS